jgi:spermidine synthase
MKAVDDNEERDADASPLDGAAWCMIPGKLIGEHGVVRLREPAWSDRQQLAARLRSGDYRKPFVVDDGEVRRLHFGLDFVQTEMRLGEPWALGLHYTRMMMAFLLFRPKPRQVLVVGLGGGSLSKFCWRELPQARITSVEVDADVIACAGLFDLPPPGPRMRIIEADARDYFAQGGAPFDVILLDGCDAGGITPAFLGEDFYPSLRARLRPHGLAVVNLAGPPSRIKSHQRLLAAAFGEQLMVSTVKGCDNRLAFAFNGPPETPDWQALNERADLLAVRHDLDFPGFLRLLQRAHRKPGTLSGATSNERKKRQRT